MASPVKCGIYLCRMLWICFPDQRPPRVAAFAKRSAGKKTRSYNAFQSDKSNRKCCFCKLIQEKKMMKSIFTVKMYSQERFQAQTGAFSSAGSNLLFPRWQTTESKTSLFLFGLVPSGQYKSHRSYFSFLPVQIPVIPDFLNQG